MALIESKPRSAKVVFSGVTQLLEITHELFHSKLSSYPDTLMAIMKTTFKSGAGKPENV
jgi:CRP-like cAMP-binding protein